MDIGDFLDVPAAERLKLPREIFCAGDSALLKGDFLRVSIVGSREASPEGQSRAGRLARELAAAGVVVVSGLAKGIDAAAHRSAMERGGRTIAVIGTPLDKAYPAEHGDLQSEIARNHLLLSQFAIGTRVFPSNFIARNRIMALVSHASVIIEAGNTSGALSQAAETQRLGKPLFLAKSVLSTPGLTWPKRFLDAGAHILDDTSALLKRVGADVCT